MDKRILQISKKKDGNSHIPRIRIGGLWLNDIGFEHGNVINVDYSKENISLKLYDSASNKEDLSLLINVRNQSNRNKPTPHIVLTGKWLTEIGFNIDEKVVVESEDGFINIKPYRE